MPLKRAPAWLKRPAGVAFGFGNRLVSFKNAARQGHGGEQIDRGIVCLSQVRLGVTLVQQLSSSSVFRVGAGW